jgi:hypothetical protein
MKNIKKKDREAFYKFVTDALMTKVTPYTAAISGYRYWPIKTTTGNVLKITFLNEDTEKSPVLSVFGRYDDNVVGAANNKYNFGSFLDGRERNNFLTYLETGINTYENALLHRK